jgi:DNA-binding CsgD family transcriptional regulator
MHESGRFPELIAAIYDAALEPAQWNDVVVKINQFVGSQACGLFSKDSISKFGVTHYYCGADPYYIQLYSETHSQFDPLAVLPPLGQVAAIPDLVAYDEYRNGRFYQEWLKPQGCRDAANVVLEKSNPKCPVLLTALPGNRMVDAEMRRRIGLVVPHARRALMINKAIASKQSEASGFADTLDGLSAGIFLVDANFHIVHVNTAGQSMLAADDFLCSIRGQITARDAQVNQGVRDIVAASGEDANAANGAAFPLTADDGERYVIHVLPSKSVLRGDERGAGIKAVAALFVRKVGLDSRSCGELLARAFELTPAELRVLLAIVDVGGVPETAETLGIAETTVKTHLHRVFSKTGTNRQADLVKLVAGFSSPLTN